ncbi:hypothetical protein [Deinococcus pimensis]|uniref:hypothetical protein n=1 Tax=Deinococcus pimensis TaxID=309888 RepID=UPI0004B89D3F|nr:hypothetical protein [Deinococcus pimensis]
MLNPEMQMQLSALRTESLRAEARNERDVRAVLAFERARALMERLARLDVSNGAKVLRA